MASAVYCPSSWGCRKLWRSSSLLPGHFNSKMRFIVLRGAVKRKESGTREMNFEEKQFGRSFCNVAPSFMVELRPGAQDNYYCLFKVPMNFFILSPRVTVQLCTNDLYSSCIFMSKFHCCLILIANLSSCRYIFDNVATAAFSVATLWTFPTTVGLWLCTSYHSHSQVWKTSKR